MLFNSLLFVVFLVVVFAVYWCTPDKYRWVVLLLSSYFFYMSSGIQYGWLILGVSVVSYVSARMIDIISRDRLRKLVLILSILVLLGVLFVFKYFDFVSSAICSIVNSVFSIEQEPVMIDIVLPVGISFYTFQTMGYVIDVYRKDTLAEKHFGKYAAFVSFFPQLVAGPIERSRNLLSQINAKHSFNYDQAIRGVKQLLWGYYKKLVIADVLSKYVQTVYNDVDDYTGFSLLLATLLFTIQIYCDFSGYSDIAIGTARLFGFELMENFKSPYFSQSIREFWSRWHISLSTWFRDYLYIPLGGNRVGRLRHSFNILITFLVSGLWHGANFTFVLWGGGYMDLLM